MTVSEVWLSGTEFLKLNNISEYSSDAMAILKYVFSFDTAKYLMNKDIQAGSDAVARYKELLNRRVSGEPVQYVIGEWDFCSNRFFVGEGVLIPRPETEQLCDIADEIIKRNSYRVIFDLCSGSGCIGITLAMNNPNCEVFLFEISETACGYIKRNIDYYGLRNVRLVNCDITNNSLPILQNPDIIISNPPYIPTEELSGLSDEVKKEPVIALDGGKDGLAFYRVIADCWFKRINAGGCVALECGENQAEIIAGFFSDIADVGIISDMYNTERFVIGFKNK